MRTPGNPDLRLRIPQLITDYALTEGYSVIVTASHSRKEIRMQYYEIAQRHNTDVILLMFSTSEEEVLDRIANAQRENLSLNGESFMDLFQKQYNSLELPADDEKALYDRVYEINEYNTDDILMSLGAIVQDNN